MTSLTGTVPKDSSIPDPYIPVSADSGGNVVAAGCRPMRLQLEAGTQELDTAQLESMPRTLFAALARKYAAQVSCPLIQSRDPRVPPEARLK